MRIGLIARMDETGVGYQTRDWFEMLNPERLLVVDMSDYNGGLKQHPEWYHKAGDKIRFNNGFLGDDAMHWITEGVDLVLSVEIFYNWKLIEVAESKKVRTALQINPEFFEHFRNTRMPYPTLILAPSPWMLTEVTNNAKRKSRVEYLPMPINRDIADRPRTRIENILHVAGRRTHGNRNGTDTFMRAMKLFNDRLQITITTQQDLGDPNGYGKNVTIIDNPPSLEHYYQQADVLVLPRRYAGLCLPLAEAICHGIIPVMPHYSPQDHYLDPFLLVPPCAVNKIQAKTTVDSVEVEPDDIAQVVNHLAMLEPKAIEKLSQKSLDLAKSWHKDVTLPMYFKLFEEICTSKSTR